MWCNRVNSDLLCFGPFEADLRTGELRKNGIRIKLSRQAFQVLTALAERPGELLLRDELRQILWPNETVVDFDQSINTAVKRIREALNDSPEEKRYLETLPRRGYRFVAEVRRVSNTPTPIPNESPPVAPLTEMDWNHLAGQMVTHYRVLELIGRGGMGVVFRAEDIRLGRQVALKLLALELDDDPLAAQRFEQEARTASTLSHPNICIVYEADVHAGRPFIAMELLEGETLGERMADPAQRSRPSIRFLIDLATQVAEALETAHERGVIHRDIKPSNIFLTRRGEVKVLDFGLAKTVLTPANDFTLSGAIPGTPRYMSPEQREGAELDGRTDLYSLGVVLYEAARGERPTPGARLSLLAASEGAQYPAKFWDILERLLEPERELRYQSARDVGSELKRLRRELSNPSNPVVPVVPKPKQRARLFWAAAIVAVLLAVVLGKSVLSRFPGAAHPTQEIRPLDSLPGLEDDLTFAPNGSQTAFVWTGGAGDDYHLYVKLIGVGTPVALTSRRGLDFSPAWSADGRFIAAAHFTAPDQADAFVIPALGGTERRVASIRMEAPDQNSRVLTWSADGKALLASDRLANSGPSGIVFIPLDGSAKKQLTWPTAGSIGDNDPEVSPDGRMLAFTRWSRDSVSEIYVQPLSGGPSRQLTNDGKRIAGLAWSEDGRDIIFSSTRGALPGLWRVPFTGGSPEPVAGAGADAVAPAVGRGSHLLAYTHQSETVNIWRAAIHASTVGERQQAPLIASPRQQISGTYSPDGTRIAFGSDRSGSFEIWMADSDGTHARQLTSFNGPITGTPRWSHDGKWIAFDSRPGGHSAVFVINVESGEQRQITRGEFDDIVPSWSLDDQSLYFCSSRTGAEEIWRISKNGENLRQVTKEGGFESAESEDGQWLYYSRRGGTIWRMPLAGGAPEVVLHELLGRYWTLRRQAIYFLRSAEPHPKIEMLDLKTGHIATIGELTNNVDWGYSGLSVSPDERWVIYAQMDELVNRIMLVTNFR
jgi:serine/threonine protein kinase/Tol biopolymer transport system component